MLLIVMATLPAGASVLFTTTESAWDASDPGRISARFSGFFGSTYVNVVLTGTDDEIDSGPFANQPEYAAGPELLIAAPPGTTTGMEGTFQQLGGPWSRNESFLLELTGCDGVVWTERVFNLPEDVTFFGFTARDEAISSLRITESAAPEPGLVCPLAVALGVFGVSGCRRVFACRRK